MNAFTAFLQAEWAERAGWTLLHSLWQIAAVAAIYAIAAFLLRGRSANSRYLLGCAAILAMLGLPAVTYILMPQHGPLDIEEASSLPVASPLPAEPPGSWLPIKAPDSVPVELSSLPGESTQSRSGLDATVTVPPAVVVEQPATTDFLSEMRRYVPWATAVWLAGVLLLSLRPFCGWFHVRRLRRRGLSPLPDTLVEAGRRVKERLRVNRAVQFAQSALVEVPTVIGSLRPMILLPASALTGLSAAELELILAHELAHVRRHDWLVNFAQIVIEALLFYHPGAWWVSGQIRKERENCCDDMAVSLGGSRTVYVQALTRLEEQRSARPEAVLAATGGSLVTRIRRLLGQPTKDCGYRHATAWVAGLVTIGFVIAALTLSPSTAKESSSDRHDVDAAAEATASGIQVELIPCVFRDGRQWLCVNVSNDSTDTVTELEAGGFPPEILVDGIRYRSTWVDTKHPFEKEPRVIRPGAGRNGGEFTLDRNWVRDDGTEELRLTADRHVVQAVLYAAEKDAPEDASRSRILSNPIEIGADGGVVGRCDVKIRVLGGGEKKPLAGLELTVTQSGWEEGVTGTTQEDGGATFLLLPGTYRIGLRSTKELLYLRIEAEQPHKGIYHRHITVAETPGDQQIDVNLYDPCELVLRAVDEETGKGVPGVAFVTENVAAEYWAQAILNDTLGAAPWSDLPKDHKSSLSDKDGYVRRLVGPREGWEYWIWSTPPEYEMIVADGQGDRIVVASEVRGDRRHHFHSFTWKGKDVWPDVEIPTPLGRKKAEHTFLLRRRKAAKPSAPVDTADPKSGISVREEAAEKLVAAGHEVSCRDGEPVTRLWLKTQHMSGETPEQVRRMGKIELLIINGPTITEAHTAILKDVQGCQRLLICSPKIEGAAVTHVKECAGVKWLKFYNRSMTDAWLKQLGPVTQLEHLFVHGDQITDAGLAHLQGMTELRELYLSGELLTDAGLPQLSRMKNLRVLRLHSPRITGTGLVHLQSMTELRDLHLSGNSLTDAGLVHLATLRHLEALFLERTNVTSEGEAQLRRALPKCKIKRSGTPAGDQPKTNNVPDPHELGDPIETDAHSRPSTTQSETPPPLPAVELRNERQLSERDFEVDTFEWFKVNGRITGVPRCCQVAFTPQLVDFNEGTA